MLNSISWQGYLLALLLLLALYYFAVLSIYYRAEIKQYLSRLKVHATGNPGAFAPPVPKEENQPPDVLRYREPENEEEQLVENKVISEKIKTIIAEAAGKRQGDAMPAAVKVTLFKELQQLLGAYPHVKGTYFEPAFTFFIAHECRERCRLHFSQEELERLWA